MSNTGILVRERGDSLFLFNHLRFEFEENNNSRYIDSDAAQLIYFIRYSILTKFEGNSDLKWTLILVVLKISLCPRI